jgi:putative glutamine amidotransferase
MHPRIGITTSSLPRPAEGDAQPSSATHLAYIQAILEAGGLPVLLPNLPPDYADEALRGLDGLLLSGGGDLAASYWGEAQHPKAGTPCPARDAFELALVGAALARDLPLLGICRGVQVMAVATGGALWQDIPDQCPGALPHRQTHARHAPCHAVQLTPDSQLARLLCPCATNDAALRVDVNSFHHQAPRASGTLFAVAAVSPDQIIEGLEVVSGARFALGVQWHPEEMAAVDPVQARLFAALVRAASGARA